MPTAIISRVEPRLCVHGRNTLKCEEVRLTYHVRASPACKGQPINILKDMPRGHPQQHADSAYLRTSGEMNTKQRTALGDETPGPRKMCGGVYLGELPLQRHIVLIAIIQAPLLSSTKQHNST